ncbi:MAG: DeoR/GlpR family DNA-binding transcription regulator [Oscillospiraceae bacterium]
MKTHRIDQMEQYIIENRTVTMNQLCEHFNVSINTVRQDIATLVSKGTIKKIYGGVTCAQKSSLQPLEERRLRNLDGKRTIARLAASFVDNFDIIYIDSGTTASLLIEYIDPAKQVTVITNSLIAVNTVMQYENIALLCLPGKLDRTSCSFISTVTVHALERYNITKSFMSTTGLSRTGEVTDCTLQ